MVSGGKKFVITEKSSWDGEQNNYGADKICDKISFKGAKQE
jgi:hypothetical protein